MFDNLPLGVYRCTPDGEFLDANPALIRILGYPDPATLDRVYASTLYVAPGDNEHFRTRLEQFGLVRSFETNLRCVDGRNIRLRNTARVHRNTDGEVDYIEGVIEDVSTAWRTSGFYQDAARFQALYRHAGISMIILDLSGEIQDVSPALRSVSGRDQDDLLSIDYSELWAEEDREEVAAEIRRLREGGEESSEHTRSIKMKDGSLRAVSVISALVRDWAEEPDHILVLIEEPSGAEVTESGDLEVMPPAENQ